MKFPIFILSFLLTAQIFSQDNHIIYENQSDNICGKIIRVEGIWIDNGRIKADLSILMQKNSKPITGGYKMGDTIDIKEGCRYLIKEVEKYGLNSDKGYVTLSNNLEPMEFLGMALTTLRTNEKFDIGGEDWIVKSISEDNTEIETGPKNARKTVTLKKNDMIWKWFTAYYISDFVSTTSDMFSKQWEIKLEPVKNYSYLNGNSNIPGELYNAPKEMTGTVQYVIRKMKYYPKQKFNQVEYDAVPVKYWVLKVFTYPTGEAHMMIEVTVLGEKSFHEYEGYKSFDTEAEALEYAKTNGITDIKLEEL